jgi:hypothetical protein
MLDVRIGDRGPRVVLLQVLHNRKGAGRKVDGIFGHHTQKAVMASRMRLFNSPGPVADPDLWMSLFDEQKLCAVDAFDTGDARAETGATIVRSAGSHVVRTGAMCNGVPEVVKGIVNQTKPPGSLAVLRTWGHGNRGRWLSFTVGEVVETSERDPVLGKAIAAENKSYVDPKNFPEMAPVLAPVGDCFDSIGIYEHHGCSLGSVHATCEMMRKLAALWDVPVTVAFGLQYIPYNAPTALRFQHRTDTFYPGGSKHAWIKRVLADERERN